MLLCDWCGFSFEVTSLPFGSHRAAGTCFDVLHFETHRKTSRSQRRYPVSKGRNGPTNFEIPPFSHGISCWKCLHVLYVSCLRVVLDNNCTSFWLIDVWGEWNYALLTIAPVNTNASLGRVVYSTCTCS